MRKMGSIGSLALSTNAIVILIIAITILGLALAFTRTIFGTLTEEVSDVTAATKLENPPTYETPMTLSKSKVAVRMDKSAHLEVAFYNKFDQKVKAALTLDECTQPNPTTSFNVVMPGEREAEVAQTAKWAVSVSPIVGTAKSGTTVCTFKIEVKKTVGYGVLGTFYEDLFVIVE